VVIPTIHIKEKQLSAKEVITDQTRVPWGQYPPYA